MPGPSWSKMWILFSTIGLWNGTVNVRLVVQAFVPIGTSVPSGRRTPPSFSSAGLGFGSRSAGSRSRWACPPGTSTSRCRHRGPSAPRPPSRRRPGAPCRRSGRGVGQVERVVHRRWRGSRTGRRRRARVGRTVWISSWICTTSISEVRGSPRPVRCSNVALYSVNWPCSVEVELTSWPTSVSPGGDVAEVGRQRRFDRLGRRPGRRRSGSRSAGPSRSRRSSAGPR